MGAMKAQSMAELEADPVVHERYWLNEMFNCREPVLPDSNPLLEFNHEKNLRIQQYQPRQNTIS